MTTAEFEGVWKYFGDSVSVNNLSLTVDEGEFMVLIGPSGCGKTTSLRMLAGLETPTFGNIKMGGRVVNDLSPGRRDISMVFQNYALMPHMTVYDNLAFGPRARREKKSEFDGRVRSVAETMGLSDHLARRPEALSGGQRQRVALGRALLRKPQLFLMDEPLSNLDAALRVQMRVEIGRLQRELGVTTVYVTHDQVEAMTLGHRIAVMKEGTLQQVGAPEDLYERPATTFVATSIGTPRMNLLPASVTQSATGWNVRLAGVDLDLVVPRTALTPVGADAGEVLVGIRPVDLGPARAEDSSFELAVESVEPMGSENFVAGRIKDQAVTARFPAGWKPAIGSSVQVAVDPGRVYLFSPSTGDTVLDRTVPQADRAIPLNL